MYNLNNVPKITKELLLSKYSQEMFFEHYLGVPVKKGLFKSPSILRIDNKPTCSFYKDQKGNLKFKDFAGPTFDFIGCVMYLFNCSYYKALQIIGNDFGFIKTNNEINLPKIQYTGLELKTTDKAQIQVEIKDFSEKELKFWNNFGISLNTLKKFKVYSIKSIFLNGNYFSSSSENSPIYGYYGGENLEIGELWRLYMPTKRNYRFLSNWSNNMWQGSKQLSNESEHCFIIKSLKDVMVLYEFGFTSIAPISENILIVDKQYNKLKDKYNNLILFFDNDLAGVKASNKYKKKYGIKCIFIKRKYAKDFSDLYKSLSLTQFWIVVNELNEIINNKVKNTKHFYIF
jgi:5S rRNA maturation endonuclease (ribonuclease M5)